jgi:hypothetical protein
MKIVPVDAENRAKPSFQELRRAWPEIVFHDAISNAHWGRLYDERPDFQFALVEERRVLAEGNSIPVSGMPASWREAMRGGFEDGDPDRLCALAIRPPAARPLTADARAHARAGARARLGPRRAGAA